MPVVVVDAVDVGPPELAEQLPVAAELLRVLPGPDRPDYALAALGSPLRWDAPDGPREVHALVLAPRFVGDRLAPDLRDLWVGLAYVVDLAQLRAPAVDLAMCHYAAVVRLNLDPTREHLG